METAAEETERTEDSETVLDSEGEEKPARGRQERRESSGENQDQNHTHTQSNSGSRKVPWSALEDSRLKSIIESNSDGVDGEGKTIIAITWGEISDLIPHRTAKQCRERWCYNLDPSIKQGPWSLEEDAILLKAHGQFQNQWALIAKYLPGRTENAVKTRYKSIMRAKRREWSEDEDNKIFEQLRLYGSKWDIIKKVFPGRTANALKTRFSHLKKGTHKSSADELAGSARQVWQNPGIVKDIDVAMLVKRKVPCNEASTVAAQSIGILGARSISDVNDNSALPTSTVSATPKKKLKFQTPQVTVKSPSQQTQNQQCLSNLPFSLNGVVPIGSYLPVVNFHPVVQQPLRLASSVESTQKREEASSKLANGLDIINEVIYHDSILSNQEKVILLEKTAALFSSYQSLVRERLTNSLK